MIHVLAGVVILGDKFLITRRPPGAHLEGKWEFPGGKIEPDETPEEGLKREMLEELGVKVIVIDKIYTSHYIYPEKTVKLDFYRCLPEDLSNFKPLSLDSQEFRWVERKLLKCYDFADADREIIEFFSAIEGVQQN